MSTTARELAIKLAQLESKEIPAKVMLAVRGIVSGNWTTAEKVAAKKNGKVTPAKFAELALKDDNGKLTGYRLPRSSASRYLVMYEIATAKFGLPAAQDVSIDDTKIEGFDKITAVEWRSLYSDALGKTETAPAAKTPEERAAAKATKLAEEVKAAQELATAELADETPEDMRKMFATETANHARLTALLAASTTRLASLTAQLGKHGINVTAHGEESLASVFDGEPTDADIAETELIDA